MRNTTVSVGAGFVVVVVAGVVVAVVEAPPAVALDDVAIFTHRSRPEVFLHSYLTDFTVRTCPTRVHGPLSAVADSAEMHEMTRQSAAIRPSTRKN